MRHFSPNGSYSKKRKDSLCADRKVFSVAISIPLTISILSLLTMCALTARAADSVAFSNDAAQARVPEANISSGSRKNKQGKGLIANAQPTVSVTEETAASRDTAQEKGGEAAADNVYARQYFVEEKQSRKRKYAHSSSTVLIYAPQAIVWRRLIDFEHYSEIFKRIESCHITKHEHGLLFAETYLKPQMFVKKLCQHTVTDVSQGPNFLQWKMLDGNFTAVLGSWTLSTTVDKKNTPVCSATYTLEADPGPVIPGAMVSFLLHQIEHEVVSSFKKACESTYTEQSPGPELKSATRPTE